MSTSQRDEDAPSSAESRFAEVLAELPPVERSALTLSEIGGLDDEEIAVRLGTNIEVVVAVLGRARSTVRTKLRERWSGIALLPQLAGWFTQGSAVPAARATGVVAAVIVGTGAVVTTVAGDAAAEGMRETRPTTIQLFHGSTGRSAPTAGTTVAVERAPVAVSRPAPARRSAAAAPRMTVRAPQPAVAVTRPPRAGRPVSPPVSPGPMAEPAPPTAETPAAPVAAASPPPVSPTPAAPDEHAAPPAMSLPPPIAAPPVTAPPVPVTVPIPELPPLPPPPVELPPLPPALP